eukprot:scaffold45996_cov36-Cyclotella_meneghiniana.AAC.2
MREWRNEFATSVLDNELKVNSEQSLCSYMREFANARACYNFVGTVADHVSSDESAACSRSSSKKAIVCPVIGALQIMPSSIPWERVLKQEKQLRLRPVGRDEMECSSAMHSLDTFGVQQASMEEAPVGGSFDQRINFHEPTAMTMKVVSLQAELFRFVTQRCCWCCRYVFEFALTLDMIRIV